MSEFAHVDPGTGALVREVPAADPSAIERGLDRAHTAFRDWSQASLEARSAPLRRLADLLDARAEALAGLMADEMGKPFAQGVGEAKKCAWACRYAADLAPTWLAPEPAATEARDTFVCYEPMGVVLAIMPWNFPLWQLFRFGASAVVAGNTIVLKHAPNVPGCAAAIEDLFRDAGFPDGVLVNLFAPLAAVPSLIADRRIAAVTLTGSTRAGEAVGAAAGKALKPAVLELGGSDAFLVLPDADVEKAAAVAAKARLQNNGQSCIAAKRFIVCAAVAERFTAAFRAHLAAAKLGPARDATTDIGPMARADLRDELHRQVQRSIANGAVCELGGEPVAGPGFYYPPTLLTHVAPGQPAWDEELFGPVASLCVVADADAAVAAANDSEYGLGVSVWTEDREAARALVPRLHGGAIFVNELVKSDPRVPFGGTKRSGYGRELGRDGMRAFTIIKTVWIA